MKIAYGGIRLRDKGNQSDRTIEKIKGKVSFLSGADGKEDFPQSTKQLFRVSIDLFGKNEYP